MLTSPAATPPRVIWIALASVPVPRPLARPVGQMISAFSAALRSRSTTTRVHVRPAIDHRSAAELDVAFLRFVDRRAIGRVRDVDGNADVRIDAVGAGDAPRRPISSCTVETA